ncbi:MAG: GIY-YIG nuclease family protein [Gammaproteobacteria bacterium]|nr:GIY-YIG nuclease family protein [Gammaproteobacteria bacterium]
MATIIYCLTNEAMPGLVKIGKTDNLQERIRNLSATNVPLPFECAYAIKIDEDERAAACEMHLHDVFSDHRVNPKREFFKVNSGRVIAAMRLIGGEGATPIGAEVESGIDPTDQKALEQYKKRLPPFRFEYAQIDIGEELQFSEDATKVAKIVTQTKILYGGERMSLSTATWKAMDELGRHSPGRTTTAYRGPDFWRYEGETLSDRRQRIEEEQAMEE